MVAAIVIWILFFLFTGATGGWAGFAFVSVLMLLALSIEGGSSSSGKAAPSGSGKAGNSERTGKANESQINTFLMDGYKSKMALRAGIEKEIEDLYSERKTIRETAVNAEKKLNRRGKKQWERERLIGTIEEAWETYQKNKEKMKEKEEQLSKAKFVLYSENSSAFEKLKMELRQGDISPSQRESDLQFVQYNIEPCGLSLRNRRFYLFPNSIWEFESDGNLAEIYKPKAIRSVLSMASNLFDEAIEGYSKAAENKDIIAGCLDLLSRCSDGKDAGIIKERIAND